MENILVTAQLYITEYGMKLVGAILILVIGLWVAKILTNLVNKLLVKKNIDPTLGKFFTALVNIALVAFVVIAAISKVGIETTSFVALLGAAGLAVGFALQGSLSNFASGVMLIIFKPIKVGNYVEGGGMEGVVEEIGIFVTTLITLDNKVVFVPNAKLTSDNIINYSLKDTRRVDLVFGIAYKEDIDNARAVIAETLKANQKVLTDPKPDILVSELADSSVNFEVRPWCKTNDYWDVYYSVIEDIKKKFDEQKIEIPFPQTDVYVHQN
ncbi:MAG: mechanosensitive ion channel [Ignavibacteriae bacterium]|nr:mechanosensitive ion channel [Ignavibacteriota bacterium]